MRVVAIGFLAVLMSCGALGQEKPFSGIFATLDTYEMWLSDKNDELLFATRTGMDGVGYEKLPNSVFVASGEKIFLAPGGRWDILRNEKTGDKTHELEIASQQDPSSKAVIQITSLDPVQVYFTILEADAAIKSELGGAFLGFGKDEIYRLCDTFDLKDL